MLSDVYLSDYRSEAERMEVLESLSWKIKSHSNFPHSIWSRRWWESIFSFTQARGSCSRFPLAQTFLSIIKKSTLTFRSRDEELTTGRGTGCEIIPLSCSLVAGKRESSHCCQKLSDRKSVIRETRDDVIRTSSLSREKVHSSLKQTFFCWIKKSRYFSSSTSLSPTATKKIKQPAEIQLFRLNLIMSSGPLIKYSQKD